MSAYFLELLTEEIPARMQARAAEDLARLMGEKLAAAQLKPAALKTLVTPRRLVLVVEGLAEAQPDLSEERKGPRVGSPEKAVEGFLRSAGLTSLDECERRPSDKGEFYFAVINRPGRPTREVLPQIMRAAMLDLPWPKSMRFPAASFRWVRPLTSVISLLDGAVLPLELDNIPVGAMTRGHRFLAPVDITVTGFDDYLEKLAAAHVVLDPADRRARIAADLAKAAAAEGLTVKDDQGLLDEVTGLVEFPVVLMGSIDEAFMSVPPEVLTTSMRTHQKYFACLKPDGSLAPRFLFVANNQMRDGGKIVIAGNERVLRARLSDAKFFWDQDRKARLETRVEKLAERVFHAKLGSVLDKVQRMGELAAVLQPFVPGADAADVSRSARLAKADLSTGMVGEFPELQGVMGSYYAAHDAEAPAVATAIAEHYSPLGPSDRCPTAPVSVVVSLADKIDSLAGFFAIDEKPTGSKDPYALRRAALGAIRIILENRLRLPLAQIFRVADQIAARGLEFRAKAEAYSSGKPTLAPHLMPAQPFNWSVKGSPVVAAILDFFADRLKVHLREQGTRHDLVSAIFALGDEDDLVRLLARVAALDAFLGTEDGANLLVAYRRASNIVRIEEKKDGRAYDGAADPARFVQDEERALAARLADVVPAADKALKSEDFAGAMAALARLRGPVDEYFDRVTVNAEEREVRENRLLMLSQIRSTLNRVADFSKIEG